VGGGRGPRPPPRPRAAAHADQIIFELDDREIADG
jgi:hypothetical protein